MTTLTQRDLLALWEQAGAHPPPARSLALLTGAGVGTQAALEELSLGRLADELMRLREAAFGAHVAALAACPDCDATLELEFDLADVRALVAAAAEPAPARVERDGYRVALRGLTSRDLAEAGRSADPYEDLLRRCVTSAEDAAGAVEPTRLPAAVLDAIAAALERADPQADLRVELLCPACEGSWSASFDPGNFLWRELDATARELLHEIHALASAYGWTESEVLGLGPARRMAYLDLVGM